MVSLGKLETASQPCPSTSRCTINSADYQKVVILTARIALCVSINAALQLEIDSARRHGIKKAI